MAFKELNNKRVEVEAENRYSEAKKKTKKAVVRAKAEASTEWYEGLETGEGQRKIFRIAKARERARKDLGGVAMVRDREENIVTEDEQIKKRWREYFDQLLNTENQRGILEQCDEVEGPEMALERVEVEKALKRMKLGKAGGPTELTSDMFLALGDEGVDWLTELLNKVWKEEEIPDDWKHSTLIPIFKGKGNILKCGDYRGIKLLDHMK